MAAPGASCRGDCCHVGPRRIRPTGHQRSTPGRNRPRVRRRARSLGDRCRGGRHPQPSGRLTFSVPGPRRTALGSRTASTRELGSPPASATTTAWTAGISGPRQGSPCSTTRSPTPEPALPTAARRSGTLDSGSTTSTAGNTRQGTCCAPRPKHASWERHCRSHDRASPQVSPHELRPRVGGSRFLETDPIEGGSANDYDYVEGDPINNLDLDGRNKCEVGANPVRWIGNAQHCVTSGGRSAGGWIIRGLNCSTPRGRWSTYCGKDRRDNRLLANPRVMSCMTTVIWLLAEIGLPAKVAARMVVAGMGGPKGTLYCLRGR